MVFELLKCGVGDVAVGPRLGRLTLPARFPGHRPRIVETPHFVAATSRGVIPHLTPDNVAKYVAAVGSYIGLEDCMSLLSYLILFCSRS